MKDIMLGAGIVAGTVTIAGSILECLHEVYGTEGELLLKGEQLPDTIQGKNYSFI